MSRPSAVAGPQTTQFQALLATAVEQLQEHVAEAQQAAEALVHELAAAGTVAAYGVGREGLAVRGFAMRLFHMGLQACVVGEMTAQHVGPGDLILASAGPGYFSTVEALFRQARRDGARTLLVTSQPPSGVAPALAQLADVVLTVPATCLPPADGGSEGSGDAAAGAAGGGGSASAATASASAAAASGGAATSVTGSVAGRAQSPLLMGSSYELALQLWFDLACLLLQERLGLSVEDITARHTNLE